MKKHSVVILEDHMLLSQAIASLINDFEEFEVSYLCTNGKEFLTKIQNPKMIPEIVLMDVNMPILNGVETTAILNEDYPDIKVLALSVDESEETIIRMLRAGARGYLLKDVEKDILNKALNEVLTHGYYHTSQVSSILVNALSSKKKTKTNLKEREIEFLQHACSELTYKEIAEKMFLSPKTVDGYRDALFQKLEIRNRVGLVLYAIKNKIVEV